MTVYQSDSDAWWVGCFARTIVDHLNHPEDDVTLRQTYRDFLKSPLAEACQLPPLSPRGRVPSSPTRPRAFLGGRR